MHPHQIIVKVDCKFGALAAVPRKENQVAFSGRVLFDVSYLTLTEPYAIISSLLLT